jgi:diacylglycerol kinase (ATP)
MDGQAMMPVGAPVGVIINPHSGRGRGKGLALLKELQSTPAPHVHVLVLNDFAELAPGLQNLAGKGVRDLFISSGDGTVQAIQTWLAESGTFTTQPRLCLLPHGTTNMTAADLGFRRNGIGEQAQFIANVTARETKRRHTIRIANPKGRGPLHGMFFGAGAVADATRYCQLAFNDKGVGGNLATFATLASVLAKSLFRAPDPNDPDRFDRPYALTVKSGAETLCTGEHLLMLVTTLDKLILGTRPFWGGATAPLRITTMPYPVPSIVRWLIPTLYGGEDRRGPPGAISRAVSDCSVLCNTPFVLDGEFYVAEADVPLQLQTGPAFDYIVS